LPVNQSLFVCGHRRGRNPGLEMIVFYYAESIHDERTTCEGEFA